MYSNNQWEHINPNDYDHFLGIGKKAKEKKEVKQAQKAEKKAMKIETKKAKAQNILSKAQSRVTLANQGIAMPSALDTTLGAATSLVSSIAPIITGTPVDLPSPAQQGQAPLTTVGPSIGDAAQAAQQTVNSLPPTATNTYSGGGGYDYGNYEQEEEEVAPRGSFRGTKKPAGKDKEKDKNKNLPIMIGAGVVVLLVLVMLLKK